MKCLKYVGLALLAGVWFLGDNSPYAPQPWYVWLMMLSSLACFLLYFEFCVVRKEK